MKPKLHWLIPPLLLMPTPSMAQQATICTGMAKEMTQPCHDAQNLLFDGAAHTTTQATSVFVQRMAGRWQIRYGTENETPENCGMLIDRLVVDDNKPLRLLITSGDNELHDLVIPELAVAVTAIPGRVEEKTISLQAIRNSARQAGQQGEPSHNEIAVHFLDASAYRSWAAENLNGPCR